MANINNLTAADLANVSSDILVAALNERLTIEARQVAGAKLAGILAGTVPAGATPAPAAAPKTKAAKAAKAAPAEGHVPRERSNDGTNRTKSDFIRDQPLTMTASEVITAAAEVGLDIAAPALVYIVRNKMKETAAAEAALAAAEQKKAEKDAKKKAAEKAAKKAAAAKPAKGKGKSKKTDTDDAPSAA